MSVWLKQSTAVTVKIGPFIDDTDGKTAEAGLTISQADVRLAKNGGDIAQKNDSTTCTHDELGYYDCPLNTTDTGTLGVLRLAVHESGALPVWQDIRVVPANVWDAFFGADKLQVDAVEISGDSGAADNLETACDGGSYNVGGGSIVAASVTGNVGWQCGGLGGFLGGWNAKNFMAVGENPQSVARAPGGFVLSGKGAKDRSWEEGAFSATVDDPAVKVNYAWFRGGWWDPLTTAWNDVAQGACFDRPPVIEGDPSPGATLFVPFTLAPRATKTVVLRLAWYVGQTNLRLGKDPEAGPGAEPLPGTYKPWYAGRFSGIAEVTAYWRDHVDALRAGTRRFSDCFYDTTLPPDGHRRRRGESHHPEIPHRHAAGRRPAVVVGGLP